MGEVYRALDRELGRDMAIKVLPRAFVADTERLARFEREARILASLNHPNIAAIYGLERFDGGRALVLELVEGETLDARLKVRAPSDSGARGFSRARALAIPDSLAIARQIAEALEAAHEKGIVHRDLKPANIKVTPAGTVKVLDFGLAKAASDSAPNLSQSPTIAISGTHDGVLLGTVAYMSPEQARGQAVDKRADIWAFGCVLFEMLAGRLAFGGDTISDHVAAILDRDPDWSALPATLPPAIHRLLRRCLEKDSWRRLRDIGDARIEIDDARVGETTGTSQPDPQARLRRWLAWSAATVVVTAVTGWMVWTVAAPRRSTADRAVTRFVIQPPPESAFVGDFAISPDGSQLAYRGAGPGAIRVYLRRVDQFDPTPLAGTEGAMAPFFSPDGEWLALIRNDTKLLKISLKSASAPVMLFDAGKDPIIGADWATDDTILIATREHALRRISAEGGEASAITTLSKDSEEIDHHSPVLLPGGRAVLFSIHEGVEQFAIAVQSLTGGRRTVVVKSGFDPQYSSSGHIVYARGSAILAVPFDVKRLGVTGPAVTLVENVATTPRDGFGNFQLSRSGSLAFEPKQSTAGRVLAWVDRSGAETPLPISPRALTNPRISPDGRRLAFSAVEGDREDIWIYEFATDRLARLTAEGVNRTPLWTPDGHWVTFSSIRGGAQQLLRQPADARPPEILLENERRNAIRPGAWAPDARTLLYVATPPTDLSDIRALAIDGAGRSEPVTEKPAGAAIRHPSVSPDGRWLAYSFRERSGQRGSEVFVQPIGTFRARRQVSVEGGREPIWSRDGRQLFFRFGGRMFGVPIDTTRGFTAGKPVLLFERPYLVDEATGLDYDVAPDGRFLMIKPSNEELAPRRLQVVLNWIDELTRRVPTGR